MAMLERDAGFCSAEEEDTEDGDVDVHSPTDASEDSVEVRVRPVAAAKGRRKCAEPRRRGDDDGPAAKRPRADGGPFRPWSFGAQEEPLSLVLREKAPPEGVRSPPRREVPRSPAVRSPPRREVPRSPAVVRPDPIARVPPVVVKSEYPEALRTLPNERIAGVPEAALRASSASMPDSRILRVPSLVPVKSEYPAPPDYYERIPGPHPAFAQREFEQALRSRPHPSTSVRPEEVERIPRVPAESRAPPDEPERPAPCPSALEEPSYSARNAEADRVRPEPFVGDRGAAGPSRAAASTSLPPGQQRNYKNMTRERRIEANARERTRVHTISAAFDTLRRAVPAYSHNQKLSKLSVLRIACSYILTLSRVAGADYSADQSRPDLSDCVENVSRTIQMEGKLRKKRDE